MAAERTVSPPVTVRPASSAPPPYGPGSAARAVPGPPAGGFGSGPLPPTLPAGPPSYDAPRSLPPLPTLPGLEPSSPAHPSPHEGTRLAIVVGVLSAIIAAVLTASLFAVLDDDAAITTAAASSDAAVDEPADLDIDALLDKAQPSVVAIQTTSGSYGGAGTGVVVSDEGHILTNWHVISGGGNTSVVMSDGSSRPAELVGSFPDDDIALIKVADTSGLVPAELGDSTSVDVGDPVVAIGNALNLGVTPSVTTGIISAKDRTISGADFHLKGLIQTDAAINPGNSGGPLIDAAGRVIGINTAILGDAQNIGFSIPIDRVKPLIEQIKEGGGDISADSAFLGIQTRSIPDVSTDVLDQYGVSASRGAFIVDVESGSAAEGADLRLGDVIVAIDGETVTTADQVVEKIRSHRAGETVTIAFERDGRRRSIEVVLGSRSDD